MSAPHSGRITAPAFNSTAFLKSIEVVPPVSIKPAHPRFRSFGVLVLLLSAGGLAGCANRQKPPMITYDNTPRPAVLQPAPPKPMRIIEIPTPLPLPGQLKKLSSKHAPAHEPGNPEVRVALADAAARVQPTRNGYINAVQVYPYSAGALYQVYTAPGEVTDIELEPGERLTGSGPVAAGDTVRWIIGDTESGSGATQRIHILVKPIRPNLTTNLVINTDRRTYLLELHSDRHTYMASVSWQYPADALIAVRGQNAAANAAAPISAGVDVTRLNFRYRITGDAPPWRPLSAFDDGAKVYIEMPPGVSQGDMPPLFIIGPQGDGQLVNYRIRGIYYIVDRLFAAAELRLGGKHQQVVRIVRTDGRPR